MPLEELVREFFDASNNKEIILSASWLDGRPPIRVYLANINPPNSTYKVKWGGDVNMVYFKRGKSVLVYTERHQFTNDDFYKLIGIVDPSILCRDDQIVSAPQFAWPRTSQEPPPTGQSPPPLVSLPEQQ